VRTAATVAVRRERSADVSEKVESTGLADAARDRIAAELARLRERHDRLEVEVKNDRGMVGDHGDAAEAIQRADELAVLAERIAELDRRLRTGPSPSNGSETLPGGTQVTVRFPDGAVVTMQVISIVEETPAGHEAETLTAGSPLGRALAGCRPGDTVTYSTPQGQNQVELLDVKFPT
jgi:transcription elongation factor GreA